MGAVRISVLFLAMSCLGVASGQEPAPTPEVSEDIAHDDPRLPVRMRLILAQTEGVGVRVLADTTRVAADALGPRSELLSVGYTYAKTGVITSDYHSQRILTGSISIPAGTVVYATVFSGLPVQSALPITPMWCAAGYNGPVTEFGQRGVCFAGGGERAVFYPVARAQSPYAAESLDIRNFHIGAFPAIEARPFPSDIELREYVVLDRVRPNGITYHVERGENARRTFLARHDADFQDEVALIQFHGGEFLVSKADDNHVEVVQRGPVQPIDTSLHWRVERTPGGFRMTSQSPGGGATVIDMGADP